MMNSNLCQHSIVFDFRLPQRRTVVGNDNQFPCKINIHKKSITEPNQFTAKFVEAQKVAFAKIMEAY